MLPKPNRLTKKKDFEMVFSKGESVKSAFLICKIAKNTLSASRIGFVVSKKVSLKATVRNKVKRRLRSIISNNIKEMKKPVDLVIIALPGIDRKSFLETRQMLLKLLNKLGI